MGTRGLTAVILDGTHKIAQYGQWDHYASGQGTTVLRFLRDSGKVVALREKAAAAHFVTEGEVDALYSAAGIDVSSGFISYNDAKMFGELYPALTRDTGGGILEVVADAPAGIGLQDEFQFATDSLFCEQAYVVDLDRNVFQTYIGFQHKPHRDSGVFAGLVKGEGENPSYAPVRLGAEFPLSDLPSDEEYERIVNGVERYYSDSADSEYEEGDAQPVEGPYVVTATEAQGAIES